MKKTFPEPILNQPIAQLDLSEKFKSITLKYGYETPGDLLNLPMPYDLLKHPGFHLGLLAEFTAFLTKNNLGHYLMPL